VTGDALYHEALLELAREARGAGRLDAADGRATRDNPLCGDQVAIEVRLSVGRITALAQRTRGCVLCEAAASLIGGAAPGSTPREVDEVRARIAAMLAGGGPPPEGAWAELAVFLPVRAVRSRHDCVLLPFDALRDALAAAKG
jgi:nitrogen fixation NifU-like protein